MVDTMGRNNRDRRWIKALIVINVGSALWFWLFFHTIAKEVDQVYLVHLASDRVFSCSLLADVDGWNAKRYLVPFRSVQDWKFGAFEELGPLQATLAEAQRRRSLSGEELKLEIDRLTANIAKRTVDDMKRELQTEVDRIQEEGWVVWWGGDYIVRRDAPVERVVPQSLGFLRTRRFPDGELLFVDAVRLGAHLPDGRAVTEQLEGCLLFRGEAATALIRAGIGD